MPIKLRKPCAAGSFYPDKPRQLKQLVKQLLARAEEKQVVKLPCVLIVPHAGYAYSGEVAGIGYAAIQAPQRVLLLGVSHYFPIKGIAVYEGAGWQSPLGCMPVDGELVSALCDAALFHVDNAVHQPEHGLEVQLPFLQCIAPDATLVPLLMSGASWKEIAQINRILSQFCDDSTLLLISSDLSHFPDGKSAEQIDHETIEAILSGDVKSFQEIVTRITPGLATRACGAAAIAVGMLVARQLQLQQAQLLAYAHSGQNSGDMSRVVGYTSICFSQ